MNVNEIKSYYQDNGKWKECEFLSGEEMAKRATELLREIERLNKIIETKNKRIKKLEDNNKDLKALLKEYKYELGLQELENTTIVDMD